jgi:hypothetical protein
MARAWPWSTSASPAQEGRQLDRAAMRWRAAAAMRDVGDYEKAGRLEQRAACAQAGGGAVAGRQDSRLVPRG